MLRRPSGHSAFKLPLATGTLAGVIADAKG
jgi:hypothetical protein